MVIIICFIQPPTISIEDKEIDEALEQMSSQPPTIDLLSGTSSPSNTTATAQKRTAPPPLSILPGREEEAWQILKEGQGSSAKRIRWNDPQPSQEEEETEEEGVLSPSSVGEGVVGGSFHINVETDSISDTMDKIKNIVKRYKPKFSVEVDRIDLRIKKLRNQKEEIERQIVELLDKKVKIISDDKYVDVVLEQLDCK